MKLFVANAGISTKSIGKEEGKKNHAAASDAVEVAPPSSSESAKKRWGAVKNLVHATSLFKAAAKSSIDQPPFAMSGPARGRCCMYIYNIYTHMSI
jgi:hypothetical protein